VFVWLFIVYMPSDHTWQVNHACTKELRILNVNYIKDLFCFCHRALSAFTKPVCKRDQLWECIYSFSERNTLEITGLPRGARRISTREAFHPLGNDIEKTHCEYVQPFFVFDCMPGISTVLLIHLLDTYSA
jgi:hypothetical protein